jgi:hypothetical protein
MMIPPALHQTLAVAPTTHAATLNGDGTPRRSPIRTLATWDDRHLLLGGLAPAALGDLGRNPTIEVAVLDPQTPGGWHLRGFAVVLCTGELHRRALARLGVDGAVPVALMQVDKVRRRPAPGPANDDGEPARAA